MGEIEDARETPRWRGSEGRSDGVEGGTVCGKSGGESA
jgi:hypothetical protein